MSLLPKFQNEQMNRRDFHPLKGEARLIFIIILFFFMAQVAKCQHFPLLNGMQDPGYHGLRL